MAQIFFKIGTKANYLALPTKDANTLYFCNDTREIFKGTDAYTEPVRFVTAQPAEPAQGVLYVNTTTGVAESWNGSAWNKVVDIVTTLSDASTDTQVPSAKAVYTELRDIKASLGDGGSVDEKIQEAIKDLDLTGNFDAKGAAAAVLGTEADTSESKTVYGAFAAIAETQEAVDALEEGQATYAIEATDSEEYAKVYTLKQTKNGVTTDAGTINIPKDLVVKSGSVKTVETANTPVEGYEVGAKYIDLLIANSEDEHIYVLVSDLIDVNTSANAALTVNGQTLTVNVVEGNGLAIGENGIEMGVASADVAGAMSTEHYTKLENMAEIKTVGDGLELNAGTLKAKTDGATIVVGDNGLEVGLIDTDKVTGLAKVATTGAYADLKGTPGAATADAEGLMQPEQVAKLNGIEESADVNKLEGVKVNDAELTIDGSKKVNITVVTGGTNGTIAVNGADVAVAGLGSAAFTASTAYDAAGSAASVLGTEEDDATANTVYGAKAYTDNAISSALTWGEF